MAEARSRRRTAELRDTALANALAFHEPKRIEKAIRPARRPSESALDEGEFETSRWWRGSGEG